MAEFDTAGFSAVANFFGSGNEKANNESTKNIDVVKTSSVRKNRKGVGAIPTTTTETTRNDLTTKKLLQVGTNRRKRNHYHDDDDDDDSDGNNNFKKKNDESSEEEDDEGDGRTSIKETRKPVSELVSTVNSTKKKKKVGKKERKAAAAAAAAAAAQDESGETNQGDDNNEEQQDKEGNSNAEDNNNPKKKPKKKRTKIRSRQKNIRKDTRLAQHKPDHLVYGRKGFQGRPMTAETRAKMRLPPSKVSQKYRKVMEGHQDGNHNTENVHGESIGTNHDENHNTSSDLDMGLGIDSILDMGVPEQSSVNGRETTKSAASTNEKAKKNSKKPKRKKPKYKNLG